MRIKFRLTATVLVAVLLFCAGSASVFAAATFDDPAELGREVKIDSGSLTQTVTFRSLDETTALDFPAIYTDEETGQRYYLWGVTYETLGTATKRIDRVSYTQEYTDLYEQEVPETIEFTNPINGSTHILKLITTTYRNTTITDRKGEVVALIEFGWQTYIPKPLDQIEVTYFDEPSGERITGPVDFRELVLDKPFGWHDVDVEAVFEVYEAEYYQMEGTSIYVPYSTGDPAIQGKEADIVRALGQDTSRFIIKSGEWLDAPHMIGSFQVRNAMFHGSRYVAKYVANYGSDWALPDCDGWDCTAVYGGSIDVLGGTPEYTIQATAIYRAFPLAGAIAAGVGLVLLLAGAVFLLIILAKRRKKKKEEDPNGEAAAAFVTAGHGGGSM